MPKDIVEALTYAILIYAIIELVILFSEEDDYDQH